MGEKFELSYLDLRRLSQAFNRDANPAEPGDYRITSGSNRKSLVAPFKVERV
jgi:hypothetical protein